MTAGTFFILLFQYTTATKHVWSNHCDILTIFFLFFFFFFLVGKVGAVDTTRYSVVAGRSKSIWHQSTHRPSSHVGLEFGVQWHQTLDSCVTGSDSRVDAAGHLSGGFSMDGGGVV